MLRSNNEVKYQKLLIFGEEDSGKTSLVKKMEKDIFEEEIVEKKESILSS